MANQFAYIEKTLAKVVDKVFAQSSLTDRLIGKGAVKVNFLDARTVKIFKIASTGLTQYQRGGHGVANKEGSASSTTETFRLEQERYSAIPLDKLDTLDDGETVLGSLSTEFIRTKVVPEFDAYRFSKLAESTAVTFGNRKEEKINANTIIKKFNEAFKWMSEQKVPETDQIIYVSPEVMELIRNTDELYKHLSQSEYKGDVTFAIEKYENRQIVVVPSDEFYTDIVIDDNGYHPSAKSKLLNFFIVDASAPIIVKKLDHAKVYDSVDGNAYLGFAGYMLTNLYYHDLFVPDNKAVGIYASVSTDLALTKASSLLVNAVGGTHGNTIINNVLTQPAGMIYDKLCLAKQTSVAIGANTSGFTPIRLHENFAPDQTNNIIVASFNDKAVAVSKNFGASGLPKGE